MQTAETAKAVKLERLAASEVSLSNELQKKKTRTQRLQRQSTDLKVSFIITKLFAKQRAFD